MAYVKFIPPIGQSTNILNNRKGIKNEVALDSTTNELIIYDGTTTGGIRLAKKEDVAELASQVSILATKLNALLNGVNSYYNNSVPVYKTLENKTSENN